jgi:hypothetical protein
VSEPRPPDEQTDGLSWIVKRSQDTLMDLPLAFRWEVTRRHPYYLRFWEPARRSYTQAASDPQQRAFEHAAALLLQGIGVSGDAPAPGAAWDSLGGGKLSQGWLSGAVFPMTLRGLVAMLLAALPPEGLTEIGRLMLTSAESAGDAQSRLHEGLTALQALKHPALDCIPAAPVVSVNVRAPQRTILQAVEELVRQWKQERDISERRRRDDKLEEYLAVWDLREGWAGDRYDPSREKTLGEAASQLGISLFTASNRYQSAFRSIVGHDYTPELWVRVFGPLKLSRWLASDRPARRATRRPWQSRSPQAVPLTTLATPVQGGSESAFLDRLGVTPDETAQNDLVRDIRTLIGRGRSNDEIVAELELRRDSGELIEYLRGRDAGRL